MSLAPRPGDERLHTMRCVGCGQRFAVYQRLLADGTTWNCAEAQIAHAHGWAPRADGVGWACNAGCAT